MQNIIQEFEAIDSETALRAFLEKNRFRVADSRSHPDQYVLGVFLGDIGDRSAKVTHRLFEVESTSASGAGRNQVVLELDGGFSAAVRFRGNY